MDNAGNILINFNFLFHTIKYNNFFCKNIIEIDIVTEHEHLFGIIKKTIIIVSWTNFIAQTLKL